MYPASRGARPSRRGPHEGSVAVGAEHDIEALGDSIIQDYIDTGVVLNDGGDGVAIVVRGLWDPGP